MLKSPLSSNRLKAPSSNLHSLLDQVNISKPTYNLTWRRKKTPSSIPNMQYICTLLVHTKHSKGYN